MALRCVAWEICCWQLNPLAMISVSDAASRTRGNKVRSPHAIDTS
jgi:hypothetical protein